ncbi:MAG: hypothetical protein K0S80_3650, partial [Neobacillus sp.]|nr:hypothetical protein [Neobacillus sp.]
MVRKPWEEDKGFQEWISKRPKAPTVAPTTPVREDTQAKRIYTYSKRNLETEWRGSQLKGLSSKRYGRSYDDKLSNWVKSKGGADSDVEGFRYWMNKRTAGGLQAQTEQAKKDAFNQSYQDQIKNYIPKHSKSAKASETEKNSKKEKSKNK